MKKILIAVIVALLVWSSYLTLELSQLKKKMEREEVVQQVNHYTLNGTTTDLTKVVEETEAKVVGITSVIDDEQTSFGSGVVYATEDGVVYIATNAHLVNRAMEIKVLFHNGKEYAGELVGVDRHSDLALLKTVPEFEVEPFVLGNANMVKKGEYVLGIGNPISKEFFGSVTFGIVSGKNRRMNLDVNEDGIVDWDLYFIQTDAAINPGNSGGALINIHGDLIGLTTMRVAGVETEGVNFAISINEMIPILNQLKEKGSVQRTIVGLQVEDVSELTIYQKAARGIALDQVKGLIVTQVLPETPSKEMGVIEGDILVSINGTSVSTFKEFREILYRLEKDSQIHVVVLRDNQELTLTGVLK